MKKAIVLTLVLLFVLTMFCVNVMASNKVGPAPNSGDGVPDGSGMDNQAQIGGSDGGSGPAPNSGDGIPDGSGF